jgi:hypothetical protein
MNHPIPDSRASWSRLLPLVLVGSVLPHLLYHGWIASQNLHPDLFIYRAGAVVGLGGESPYPAGRVQPLVAEQFPDMPWLRTDSAFLMPPEAIALFAPLAVLPWPIAKAVWVAIVTAVGAAGAVALTAAFGRRPEALPRASLAVIPILLLNPITLAAQVPGQTSLFALGCIAVGQWCFERKWPVLGTLLWAVPFVKPHLALPLVPLAWYLGGWKRAGGLVAAVAGLNLLGGAITGSPLLVLDYLRELSERHQAVTFNRAADNSQISSWNRALIAVGGPVIELSVMTTVIGYATWFVLLALRAWRGGMPSAAWAAAAAGVGAALCSQVLVYELLILALAVPLVLDWWEARRRWWAAALTVLLLAQAIPQRDPPYSYRSFGVLAAAALVLTGPLRPRPT